MKPDHPRREAAAAPLVFNALHSAQLVVDKQMARFDGAGPSGQVSIVKSLHEHAAWLQGIIESLACDPSINADEVPIGMLQDYIARHD